jgi:hypothetical protein
MNLLNNNELEGMYHGEEILIVGNGPSLSHEDIEKLSFDYSFGIRRINQIYEKTQWRPDFYFCGNTDLNTQEIKQNVEASEISFLDDYWKNHFSNRADIVYFPKVVLNDPQRRTEFEKFRDENIERVGINDLMQYWSEDIFNKIYIYHSMYSVMQIVDYLGFTDVYLIGNDLNYGYFDPHMIFDGGLDSYIFNKNHQGENVYVDYLKECIREGPLLRSIVNGFALWLLHSRGNPLPILQQFEIATDPYHFSNNYQIKPHDSRHSLEEKLYAHQIIRRIFQNKGKEIINLTRGGKLDVHPRMKVEDKI